MNVAMSEFFSLWQPLAVHVVLVTLVGLALGYFAPWPIKRNYRLPLVVLSLLLCGYISNFIVADIGTLWNKATVGLIFTVLSIFLIGWPLKWGEKIYCRHHESWEAKLKKLGHRLREEFHWDHHQGRGN